MHKGLGSHAHAPIRLFPLLSTSTSLSGVDTWDHVGDASPVDDSGPTRGSGADPELE